MAAWNPVTSSTASGSAAKHVSVLKKVDDDIGIKNNLPHCFTQQTFLPNCLISMCHEAFNSGTLLQHKKFNQTTGQHVASEPIRLHDSDLSAAAVCLKQALNRKRLWESTLGKGQTVMDFEMGLAKTIPEFRTWTAEMQANVGWPSHVPIYMTNDYIQPVACRGEHTNDYMPLNQPHLSFHKVFFPFRRSKAAIDKDINSNTYTIQNPWHPDVGQQWCFLKNKPIINFPLAQLEAFVTNWQFAIVCHMSFMASKENGGGEIEI